jgi:predicted cobalt transporter CbtA
MHRPLASVAFARRTALAVLVLFVIGSIASSLHMALVRHAVCAEHGEVVHVAPAAPAPGCDSALHEHDSRQWSSTPSDSSDAHDHCPVALQARERGLAWTPTRAVVQKHGPPLVRTCAPSYAPVPTLSRLFFAPKHSPPV